jgi:hypothetical protein
LRTQTTHLHLTQPWLAVLLLPHLTLPSALAGLCACIHPQHSPKSPLEAPTVQLVEAQRARPPRAPRAPSSDGGEPDIPRAAACGSPDTTPELTLRRAKAKWEYGHPRSGYICLPALPRHCYPTLELTPLWRLRPGRSAHQCSPSQSCGVLGTRIRSSEDAGRRTRSTSVTRPSAATRAAAPASCNPLLGCALMVRGWRFEL